MVRVEEQIIEAVRTLSPTKQQEVLDFAEFLKQSCQHLKQNQKWRMNPFPL